mmetsp:Transcript_19391/g.54705  ORF Transcript_19391/g.54705 Transcript_19391/m.54705 type:complete len:272 (-) Transcript_19391:442-1257(-)
MRTLLGGSSGSSGGSSGGVMSFTFERASSSSLPSKPQRTLMMLPLTSTTSASNQSAPYFASTFMPGSISIGFSSASFWCSSASFWGISMNLTFARISSSSLSSKPQRTFTTFSPTSTSVASNQLSPYLPSTLPPTSSLGSSSFLGASTAFTFSLASSSSLPSKPHFTFTRLSPTSTIVASNQLFPYFPSALPPTSSVGSSLFSSSFAPSSSFFSPSGGCPSVAKTATTPISSPESIMRFPFLPLTKFRGTAAGTSTTESGRPLQGPAGGRG